MANLFRTVLEVPEVAETMVRDRGSAPTMAITCSNERHKAIVQHNGRGVAPGDDSPPPRSIPLPRQSRPRRWRFLRSRRVDGGRRVMGYLAETIASALG